MVGFFNTIRHFSTYRKEHGWGINSRTQSKFPAVSQKTVTTPLPDANEKPWAADGNAVAPVQKEYETHTTAPAADPRVLRLFGSNRKNKVAQDQRKQLGIYNEGSRAIKVKLNSKSPKKFTHDLNENIYAKYLQDDEYLKTYFKGSAPPKNGKQEPSKKDRVELESAIRQVLNALPKEAFDILPAELKGGASMVLVQAFAAVSKEYPNGIADVVRGVNYLMNMDLLAYIRDPKAAAAALPDPLGFPCPDVGTAGCNTSHDSGAGYDAADLDCAWRIAQVLGSTPEGFDMLKRITVPPTPVANMHKSVEIHDNEMLHVYLIATREMHNQWKMKHPNAGPQAAVVGSNHHPEAVYDALDEAVKENNNKTAMPFPGRRRPDYDRGDGNGADAGAIDNGFPNLQREMTVLEKALLALKDHLDLSHNHAQDRGIKDQVIQDQGIDSDDEDEDEDEDKDTRKQRKATEEFEIPPEWRNGAAWAIAFVQNGIYSDDIERETMPDPNDATATVDNPLYPAAALYRKINTRTERVAIQAHRAYRVPANKFREFTDYLGHKFVGQKNKSPFRAYNALGSGYGKFNIFKFGSPKNAVGFMQSSGKSALHDTREIKENLIANVIKGLDKYGGGKTRAEAMASMKAEDEKCALDFTVANVTVANGRPSFREIKSAVRRELLQFHLDNTSFPRFYFGEPLDRFCLEKVEAKLYKMFDETNGTDANDYNMGSAKRTQLQNLLKQENDLGYSASVLASWAHDVGAPFGNVEDAYKRHKDYVKAANVADDLIINEEEEEEEEDDVIANEDNEADAVITNGAGAKPVRDGYPDWVQFARGIARVSKGDVYIPPTPNLNKANLTEGQRITATADSFEQAVSEQELGGKWHFANGGVAGFNTGPLTRPLTNIPTVGILNGKLKFAWDKTDQAYISGGTLTTGNELFMGRQTTKKRGFGIGLNIGPGKTNKNLGTNYVVGATFGGDLNFGRDTTKRFASVFRFRRTKVDVNGDIKGLAKWKNQVGSEADHARNVDLGDLTGLVMDHTRGRTDGKTRSDPCNAFDQNSILKRACQEYPTLSLSYMKTKTTSKKAGISGGAAVGLSIPMWRLTGASLIGGYDRNKHDTEWVEEGGALHVDKRISTKDNRLYCGTSGPAIAVVPGGMEMLGLPGVFFGDLSVDFRKYLYRQTDSYIYEHGKLAERTYRTRSFATTADCFDYFSRQAAMMAVDKAFYYSTKYHKSKTNDPLDHGLSAKQVAETEQIILDEYNRLMRHFEQQIKRAELNQVYQLYYEPKKETVRAVNIFKSIMETAKAAGDMKRAEEVQKHIDKILWDDRNWHHGFLVDQDLVQIGESSGFNIAGKFQEVNNAEFNRIRTWI